MKYEIVVYESWNTSLFASTKEEAMYWGKRMIELGSMEVTILEKDCDTNIYTDITRLQPKRKRNQVKTFYETKDGRVSDSNYQKFINKVRQSYTSTD